MSTTIVLGNGSTLVNLDENLNLKDFYWPFVGEADHLSTTTNEIFFVINGQRVYLNHGNFDFEIQYVPNSLVSESTAISNTHQLKITFRDFVVHDQDIFVRKISFTNLGEEYREILMFFKHNFVMREDDTGNTATWYPQTDLMCHYKKNTYLGVGLSTPVHEFTCAAPNDNNGEGAVPDRDGRLAFNPVSTGTTESCISLELKLDSGQSQSFDYFIVCGHNYDDLSEKANFIRKTDREDLLKQTSFHWQNWINPKTNFNLFQEESLNKRLADLYAHSLLIIRSQTDNNGAIVAANDSEFIKKGGKDSYSYMWPRDGANAALAYIEAGYPDLARNFFKFCEKGITQEGFLHHKYYSDISKGIGSSWHPWVDKYGNEQLPIQEDETASVINALYHYYRYTEDLDFITELWNSFIVPALNFLIDYRFTGNDFEDNNPIGFKLGGTGLPKPSYDLWEIHWGVHSYTVASVYSALRAGAMLAEARKIEHLMDVCDKTAKEIKIAYEKYFYDEKEGVFINSYFCDSNQNRCKTDKSQDSSISALWSSNMFPVDDERIKNTMAKLEDSLWIDTEVGGFARKEFDNYLKIDSSTPGNPWFISTLWMAQYWNKRGDEEKTRKYIKWVIDHVDSTGLFAEQAHPHTGFGISMKPLTWSHSEFIQTLNML